MQMRCNRIWTTADNNASAPSHAHADSPHCKCSGACDTHEYANADEYADFVRCENVCFSARESVAVQAEREQQFFVSSSSLSVSSPSPSSSKVLSSSSWPGSESSFLGEWIRVCPSNFDFPVPFNVSSLHQRPLSSPSLSTQALQEGNVATTLKAFLQIRHSLLALSIFVKRLEWFDMTLGSRKQDE